MQAWDSFALYSPGERSAPINQWNPLCSYGWLAFSGDYSEIRLIPPYVHDANCPPQSYRPYFYIPFAYLAGTLGMRINSGHLSRQPEQRIDVACREQAEEIEGGRMAEDAVYVVSGDYFERMQTHEAGVARCGLLDGYHVCVRADRRTKLSDLLVERPRMWVGQSADGRPAG